MATLTERVAALEMRNAYKDLQEDFAGMSASAFVKAPPNTLSNLDTETLAARRVGFGWGVGRPSYSSDHWAFTLSGLRRKVMSARMKRALVIEACKQV